MNVGVWIYKEINFNIRSNFVIRNGNCWDVDWLCCVFKEGLVVWIEIWEFNVKRDEKETYTCVLKWREMPKKKVERRRKTKRK